MGDIKILWNLAGPLRAQPFIAVSTTAEDEDEMLESVRDILATRKPKLARLEIMGGNFEPSVLAVANELHVTDKQPNIISWLYRKLTNSFNGVAIKVERHNPR